MADHYKTLGVSAAASSEEVKSAYKALAKKWHPDKNQSNKEKAEENFKKVSIMCCLIYEQEIPVYYLYLQDLISLQSKYLLHYFVLCLY